MTSVWTCSYHAPIQPRSEGTLGRDLLSSAACVRVGGFVGWGGDVGSARRFLSHVNKGGGRSALVSCCSHRGAPWICPLLYRDTCPTAHYLQSRFTLKGRPCSELRRYRPRKVKGCLEGLLKEDTAAVKHVGGGVMVPARSVRLSVHGSVLNTSLPETGPGPVQNHRRGACPPVRREVSLVKNINLRPSGSSAP